MTTATVGRARACVVDPTLFASTDILDHTLAARLCDVCPVRVSCREATEETAKHRPDLLHGTYAETDRLGRRKIRTARNATHPPDQRCPGCLERTKP